MKNIALIFVLGIIVMAAFNGKKNNSTLSAANHKIASERREKLKEFYALETEWKVNKRSPSKSKYAYIR